MKVIIILCTLFFWGCSSLQTQVGVDKNNFFTCTVPELNIQIDKDFKYISEESGRQRKAGLTKGYRRTINFEYLYMFKDFGSANFLQRVIIIKVLKVETFFERGPLFKNKRCIYRDKAIMGGHSYQICKFRMPNKAHIQGKSYRRITGSKNNILIEITYYHNTHFSSFSESPPFKIVN